MASNKTKLTLFFIFLFINSKAPQAVPKVHLTDGYIDTAVQLQSSCVCFTFYLLASHCQLNKSELRVDSADQKESSKTL